MTKILKKATSDSSQAEILALVIQVLQLVAQSGLVKAESSTAASSLNDVVAMLEAEADMPSNVMKDPVAE
ncbi:hypothetical protein MMC22_002224 [Lobaria immixta]|nr:hypothetical protein [Lobaria immixta]